MKSKNSNPSNGTEIEMPTFRGKTHKFQRKKKFEIFYCLKFSKQIKYLMIFKKMQLRRSCGELIAQGVQNHGDPTKSILGQFAFDLEIVV